MALHYFALDDMVFGTVCLVFGMVSLVFGTVHLVFLTVCLIFGRCIYFVSGLVGLEDVSHFS